MKSLKQQLGGTSFEPDSALLELEERLRELLKETPFHDESLAFATHIQTNPFWKSALASLVSGDVGLQQILQKPLPVLDSIENGNKFTFIDLFAGIGGFRLALESVDGRSVFASEWESTAQRTYFDNHGEYPFGDINKFTESSRDDEFVDSLVPDHDVLAGGFPCQPFSLAGVSARNAVGKAHGFECKTQGTLFFSIERIAKVKKPKILLLENVKNLVGHDGGRTFGVIQDSLKSLGYRFYWKLLDSQTLVAQRRVRCFMVAVREDIAAANGDFEFPTLPSQPIPLATVLEAAPDDRYTITQKLWDGHQNRTKRNLARGTGFTALEADVNKPSNTIVARYGKDGKECLVPQANKPPRYLTISECRRLFGYPDDFKLPNSKTPSYKLLGNSVVVPLVTQIAEAIFHQYLSER